jgi:Tol biopolymer transport system component
MKRGHIKESVLFILLVLALFAVVLLAAACSGGGTTTTQAVTTTGQALTTTTQGATTTTAQAVTTTTQAVRTTEAATTPVVSLPAPTVTGTLAFAKVTDINGKGWGDIWVINTDGTGMRRLTATSDTSEEQLAWSPDGSKIAYGAGDPESIESYTLGVMNADGSGIGPLTGTLTHGLTPSWSPDGTRVAFTVFKRLYNTDIAVMDIDGSAVREVTSAPNDEFCPAWLPDGTLLFLYGWPSEDIYRMNADGSGLTAVTEGGYAGSYAPSADGKHLVLHDTQRDRLVVLPVSGQGSPVVLVDKVSRYVPSATVSLTWSPDGKAIAFSACLEENDPHGSPLYVVNADGSGLSMVPNTQGMAEVAWRP